MLKRLEVLTYNNKGTFCEPTIHTITTMFHKINELVDHVNNIEQSSPTDTIPLSDAAKAFNVFGKEVGKEVFKEKEPQFGEWVSVKDKFPPVYEKVLVLMPGEAPFPIVHQGYVNKQGVWYANNFLREANEITHWMPMPNPPEEFTKDLIGRGVDK